MGGLRCERNWGRFSGAGCSNGERQAIFTRERGRVRSDMANAAVEVRRLAPGDEGVAREMFAMMEAVFAEDEEDDDVDEGSCDNNKLRDEDVAGLLRRGDFWALVAAEDGVVVGGLTAHVLPMTRSRSSELFLYDLAVETARQRRGIGRALVEEALALAERAGIRTTFVPADDEDTHALDFYRALGGTPSPVTFFTFSR